MKCVVLALFALVAAVAAQQLKEPIPIVRLNADVQPDGGFVYEYETANGIKAEARGQPSAAGPEGPAIVVQGQYAYTADDGTPIQVQYTADENGYHPEGAHLPVPPPIPEAILRSLEYNAKYYKGEDEQDVKPALKSPAFAASLLG